jgi:plastocyanin
MRKHMFLVFALAALVSAGAVQAASPAQSSLVIRHQLKGCHSWSLDGSAFKVSQSLTFRRGSTITITNNDVMPHTLVKTSGPAVSFAGAKLGHMGAMTTVRFSHPGVYRFVTKPGEDYMAGVKTIGEDNVLRLTVTVK